MIEGHETGSARGEADGREREGGGSGKEEGRGKGRVYIVLDVEVVRDPDVPLIRGIGKLPEDVPFAAFPARRRDRVCLQCENGESAGGE